MSHNEPINSLIYEQYNSAWCKIHNKADIFDSPFIANANPHQLIAAYTEDSMCSFTPESFLYRHALKNSDWTLSQNNEHQRVLDSIITFSAVHLTKKEQHIIDNINENLSRFGFKNIDDFIAQPDKQGMTLKKLYHDHGLTEKGAYQHDFVDYQQLKIRFLQSFASPTTQFFVNTSADCVEQMIADKKIPPAVIAINAQKIGIFRFNY